VNRQRTKRGSFALNLRGPLKIRHLPWTGRKGGSIHRGEIVITQYIGGKSLLWGGLWKRGGSSRTPRKGIFNKKARLRREKWERRIPSLSSLPGGREKVQRIESIGALRGRGKVSSASTARDGRDFQRAARPEGGRKCAEW